jgi:D-amino-acid dehydrogenase
MTPDGTPVIGATRITNLFLSTGHGTPGWTVAAGPGRAMRDLLIGKSPEIEFEGLTVERYS